MSVFCSSVSKSLLLQGSDLLEKLPDKAFTESNGAVLNLFFFFSKYRQS